jgi:hypothetical protein
MQVVWERLQAMDVCNRRKGRRAVLQLALQTFSKAIEIIHKTEKQSGSKTRG